MIKISKKILIPLFLLATSFASSYELAGTGPVTRIENAVENKKPSLQKEDEQLKNSDKPDYKTGNTKTINKFEVTTFETDFNVYTNPDFNREAHSNENYVLLTNDLMIINTVEGKVIVAPQPGNSLFHMVEREYEREYKKYSKAEPFLDKYGHIKFSTLEDSEGGPIYDAYRNIKYSLVKDSKGDYSYKFVPDKNDTLEFIVSNGNKIEAISRRESNLVPKVISYSKENGQTTVVNGRMSFDIEDRKLIINPPEAYEGVLGPINTTESVAIEFFHNNDVLRISSSNRFVMLNENKEDVLNKYGLKVSNKKSNNEFQTIDDLKAKYPGIEFLVESIKKEDLKGEKGIPYLEPTPNLVQIFDEWMDGDEKNKKLRLIKQAVFGTIHNAAVDTIEDHIRMYLGERVFDAPTLVKKPIRGHTSPLTILEHEYVHALDHIKKFEEDKVLGKIKERIDTILPSVLSSYSQKHYIKWAEKKIEILKERSQLDPETYKKEGLKALLKHIEKWEEEIEFMEEYGLATRQVFDYISIGPEVGDFIAHSGVEYTLEEFKKDLKYSKQKLAGDRKKDPEVYKKDEEEASRNLINIIETQVKKAKIDVVELDKKDKESEQRYTEEAKKKVEKLSQSLALMEKEQLHVKYNKVGILAAQNVLNDKDFKEILEEIGELGYGKISIIVEDTPIETSLVNVLPWFNEYYEKQSKGIVTSGEKTKITIMGREKDFIESKLYDVIVWLRKNKKDLFKRSKKIIEKNIGLDPYSLNYNRTFNEMSTLYNELSTKEVQEKITGNNVIRILTQLAFDSDKITKTEYLERMGNYCNSNPCGKCLEYTLTCEK